MNQTKEDLVIGPEETTMDTSPLETDISLIVITEVRQDTGRITDKMEDTITTGVSSTTGVWIRSAHSCTRSAETDVQGRFLPSIPTQR